MAKNSNAAENIVDIGTVEVEAPDEGKKTKNKKVLKSIEKATRDLDNVLSDLVGVEHDFQDIQTAFINESSTDINPRDEARVNEASEVLKGVNLILFHLTARLARKHVGKDIDPVDVKKRKGLKK